MKTTKNALADSLKKLLLQKPLNKITVVDITEDCEVNRQTFYYHFLDIYDLIDWIFSNDADKAIDGKKTYDTWQDGFLQIFEYVLKNKNFVSRTYYSLSRERLEHYLYSETYNLLMGVIEEQAVGISVHQEDKTFIANFYKYGFVGLILDWIGNGMKEDPEKIIQRLNTLIEGDISKALLKFKKG
ncbi:MAG TPA: TetR-like C-terminal domain-containing protein [Thermotogota bacterium]|nr:TetR-like C-terminal domain-containing protein [Thermotogota bacterium]HPJ87740.1 TetR-like C-terminal domain-containing protein [Thermotogota bacterium]HPR96928.1 TetR-like C-terminal domain-containing protein [Thermotogota bacterium]